MDWTPYISSFSLPSMLDGTCCQPLVCFLKWAPVASINCRSTVMTWNRHGSVTYNSNRPEPIRWSSAEKVHNGMKGMHILAPQLTCYYGPIHETKTKTSPSADWPFCSRTARLRGRPSEPLMFVWPGRKFVRLISSVRTRPQLMIDTSVNQCYKIWPSADWSYSDASCFIQTLQFYPYFPARPNAPATILFSIESAYV